MAEPGSIFTRPSRWPTIAELESWIGWRVDDINGSMIGRVERVIDDEAGAPAWIVVGEFRLGEGRRLLIPAADAVGDGGRVWSPHPRELIRASARISGPRPSAEAVGRLRAHYGGRRRVA